jgi:integrase
MLVVTPRIIVAPADIAEILNAPEPIPDNWHPTLEQIAAFMDEAETTATLRYALLILTFAGRPAAVRELGTDQFDARHKLLAFNQKNRRQTKKYRPTNPVPERLLPHMMRWAEEGELFVAGPVRDAWDATLARYGGPHLTGKSLRHFMATEMRKRGVPPWQIERWMGHRRQSTNDRYGQFSSDYLAAARDCADAVLAELEALCTRSIYRQVTAKPKAKAKAGGLQRFDPIGRMVGGTGIEPVTPTMSRLRSKPKCA